MKPIALTLVITLLLPSCALVRLPLRVAGGAVRATEAAVTAPADARDKRTARKAREQRAAERAERAERRKLEPRPTPELPDAGESLPDFSEDLPKFPDDPLQSMPADR